MGNPDGASVPRFLRWAATALKERQETLRHAVATLLPPLTDAGFKWLDKSFDCGNVPVHTINLERERVPGQIDFVMLVFDKRQRARFQVLFGTKEKEGNRWIRSGALVWKKENESVKFKWWGASWWHLDKEATLVDAIDSAAALLPQVLRFLSEGVAGENVWPIGITRR